MTKLRFVLAAAFLFAIVPSLQAQSVNATLTGRATVEGRAAPGVTVTVSSPALQRERSTTTGADGDYTIPALPPGTYVVRFELQGLQSKARRAELKLADLTRVDADLHPTALQENVTVTPSAATSLESPEVTTNFDAKTIEYLPIGRGIIDTVALAPGVQNTGPNKQLVINGAQSYDNLYLVNGVTITDQTRGQPHNLFIEDSIQETTVLTAGISAEYGRFTGGVVNVITKSGGNQLGGTLRDTLSSEKWASRTPLASEPDHLNNIYNDYQATLGGRIIRDRLWYFMAGRFAKRDSSQALFLTNTPYTSGRDETRYEGKLTASLGRNHSIVGSYMKVRVSQTNLSIDPADFSSLYDAVTPNTLLALHYTGILTRDFVLEAQYSRKTFTLSGGSPHTDPVTGTMVLDIDFGYGTNAPPFCSSCGSSARDNHEYLLKGSYFLSTARFGTHNLTAGIDDFHEIRTDNEHQSPSDYLLLASLFTQGDQVFAHVVPDESIIQYSPILFPGSQPADYATRSAYVNDRIDWGSHFTFNVGARYDRNVGHDALGNLQARDSRLSPRAGAIWDVGGDGRNRFSATFGQYVSKVQQTVGGSASVANIPETIYYIYEGPELNDDPDHPIPTPEVLKQVFAWFNSAGGTANEDLIVGSRFSGGTVLAGNLVSPVARELSFGYGRQFGTSGAIRADYVRRRWSDFYVKHVSLATGKITDPAGIRSDKTVVDNSNAGLERRYEGVLLQGSYRLRRGFYTAGNYTWSKLRGNVEGETGGSAAVAVASPADFYPEYTSYAQNHPVGWLSADVRHRANAWVGYELPTRAGRFNFTVLEQYHSGRPWSEVASFDPSKGVTKNPGYLVPPRTAAYFITGRGELRTDSINSTGLGLNYAFPFRGAEIFAEADVANVFNAQGVEDPSFLSTVVITSRTDRNLVAFNPYATKPVECPRGVATSSAQCKGIANYQLSAQFGTVTRKDGYQLPRTYGFSLGARF